MKLLVTGGAGFIGSNFIHYVLEKYSDYHVVNLDALTYAGNLENLKKLEKDPRYTFVKGDIRDAKLVDDLVADADAVVHFAAETHVDRSILGPEIFIETNVRGTYVLLEAVKKHGKRFHHVSTDEVFGALGPNDPPFNEDTPYDPSSPYSASKAAADHLVRSYFRTYGLPVTLSNCTNNYGPYLFPEKLLALAITNVLEGKKVPLYGDGKQVRDWLYVTDHCRALMLILEKGRLGETYCVGGNSETVNVDIVNRVAQLLGKDESVIEYVKDRPGHDWRYAMDYSKIKSELGWDPTVSLGEGLQKTVSWFQENEEWWRRAKSGEYQKYYDTQYPPSVSHSGRAGGKAV